MQFFEHLTIKWFASEEMRVVPLILNSYKNDYIMLFGMHANANVFIR